MQDEFMSDLLELLSAVQKEIAENPADKKEIRKAMKLERDILTYQATLRGKYLLAFTALETSIENLIAIHFCQDFDYRNMLASWVLKPIPFSRKIVIVNNVLDCYQLKSIKKSRDSWLPNLEKINRFRNNVAHLEPANTASNNKKQSFHLITHKGAKREVIEITRADFERNLSQVVKANSVIFVLIILMLKEKELNRIANSNTAPAP